MTAHRKGVIGTSSGLAFAVALQGDGKIAAAGYCYTGTSDFCLARYNPDGSLDTGFDGDGKVTTAIGTGSDLAFAVALHGDGKIVAAGSCDVGGSSDFCLVRYEGVVDTDGDGVPDPADNDDDNDTVADSDDGCPLEPGSVANGGCPGVGGVVEHLTDRQTPATEGAGQGARPPVAAIAAAAVALVAAGWYVRRRYRRS